MVAVNKADVRDQDTFSGWFTLVSEGETLVISDAQDRKVVMLPIRDFDEMNRSREREAYLAKLDRGLDAIKRGEPGIRKTMAKLEAMADE